LGPDITAGSTGTVEVERWATVYSIEYTWNYLRLAAEYRLENTKNQWGDLGFPDNEVDAEGYYASASYRFTDWLEVGAYYSEYYPDKDDRDGDQLAVFGWEDFRAWEKDFALTARFDINEYWLLKLEGHALDGAAGLLAGDNPDGLDQHDFLLAAKVTFNF
jgi:hypothetical protein